MNTHLDQDQAPITCEHAAALFCEGRDRDLTQVERQDLKWHIRGCDACTAASRQLETIFGQLTRWLQGEEP